jgi:hypothetical protein
LKHKDKFSSKVKFFHEKAYKITHVSIISLVIKNPSQIKFEMGFWKKY